MSRHAYSSIPPKCFANFAGQSLGVRLFAQVIANQVRAKVLAARRTQLLKTPDT
jgi:hypothetical protein